MKQCTYCGKEFPDDAISCAVDGRALREVRPLPPLTNPPPIGQRQQIVDTEHLRLLSIFHFVVAGLACLGIMFLLLHYLIFRTLFSNPNAWNAPKNAPPFPPDFFKLFVWFYVLGGLIFLCVAVLNFLSGTFLRKGTHRTFSIVIAGLNCLQIPFGTVLGIFTLIVLSRSSVCARYSD